MVLTKFGFLGLAVSCLSNVSFGEELDGRFDRLGGIIGANIGTVDTGLLFAGGELGLSYRSTFGTHYLVGRMDLHSLSGSGNSSFPPFIGGPSFQYRFTTLRIGYRYGFPGFDDFEPFVEYGWGFSGSKFLTSDALGNPTSIDFSSSGDYFSVGTLYRLTENFYVKGELNAWGLTSRFTPQGALLTDALGNPLIESEEFLISGSIGITFKF